MEIMILGYIDCWGELCHFCLLTLFYISGVLTNATTDCPSNMGYPAQCPRPDDPPDRVVCCREGKTGSCCQKRATTICASIVTGYNKHGPEYDISELETGNTPTNHNVEPVHNVIEIPNYNSYMKSQAILSLKSPTIIMIRAIVLLISPTIMMSRAILSLNDN